ncbi:MAG: FAD-dependent protein [Ginsengibacter sp.]
MQKKISLKLTPQQSNDPDFVRQAISENSGFNIDDISGFHILKKSLDARGKAVWIHLTALAFIHEPFAQKELMHFDFKDVLNSSKTIVIIGAGPAGLFAAIQLIEYGIKPVILERGKDVRERRRDLALLNKEGIINPESNYCFGEGGAGTYSDGKLYTRSSKRGNIDRILNLFVHFGAGENVLYDAHPHIGTNKLPHIITSMRNRIIACGGEIHFNKKLTDLVIENDVIKQVITSDGNSFIADDFILATGHSARDIYSLLHEKKLLIIAKPFALGVRIEHPQKLINSIQYSGCANSNNYDGMLPPAAYSLVEQVNGRGVFSFCMCPGGIIAPAATGNRQVVTNGWSPSKRNNPYANSGIVVQTELDEVWNYMKSIDKKYVAAGEQSPLLMMSFQNLVEEAAYIAGGGNFVAPAQRMTDFVNNIVSSDLPKCSYIPGINSVSLYNVLPTFISERLKIALKAFGKKMPPGNGHHGYYTREAVLVATESRTSSPVRIPRDEILLNHPQVKNLYPCGEGAGYAGGIVSAAMDGERVAKAISLT